MKSYALVILSMLMLITVVSFTKNSHSSGTVVPPAPNGIKLPKHFRDWKVIGISHREDNHTLRVILGNDIAVVAARSGNTLPWPDGAALGKLVWKDTSHEVWKMATVPGKFVHAEFMIKDGQAYASTGGWGFARWIGREQTPYGQDADFVKECYGCHMPMKENDYVFTHPAMIP